MPRHRNMDKAPKKYFHLVPGNENAQTFVCEFPDCARVIEIKHSRKGNMKQLWTHLKVHGILKPPPVPKNTQNSKVNKDSEDDASSIAASAAAVAEQFLKNVKNDAASTLEEYPTFAANLAKNALKDSNTNSAVIDAVDALKSSSASEYTTASAAAAAAAAFAAEAESNGRANGKNKPGIKDDAIDYEKLGYGSELEFSSEKMNKALQEFLTENEIAPSVVQTASFKAFVKEAGKSPKSYLELSAEHQ